ncbi:hypothetical protein [Inhella crocodyli]|jgi:hypothetical protein|uniref:Uncharacterized protein n=1 Tax=Inhella crocodyli TaxID=2499851 RepID=A0A3S2V4U0_9BURK|nr:hypothetical protein [Inhella crocodyli]RVT88384.1 hypothetical protein EOD73_05225 [Inhella crocodyli]
MTDRDVIQAAYEDQLAQLFEHFFANTVEAEGQAAELAQAERAFQAGVRRAREVRDRALALL